MKHTVYEHQLASGGKGLIIDVPGSDVVNILFRFNSGFQFADRSHYELSHVMEHLIGCGTEDYPVPGDFKKAVQRNGAMRNAYTSSAVNGYVFECAEFEFERILKLAEGYLTRPTFPEASLATELSNVREELMRMTTEYGNMVNLNLYVKSHPKEHMGISTRLEQLSGITRDQVVNHYKTTHTQENFRFYLAGPFADGGKKVVTQIEQLAAALPTGPRLEVLDERGQAQRQPIVQSEDIQQLYYAWVLFGGELAEEQKQALLILRSLLFGGFSGRIYGEARDRGLAYHVAGSTGSTPKTSSFSVGGFVSEANREALFELIHRHYRRVVDGEVNASDVETAANFLVGNMKRNYQTAGDILSWYVNRYDSEEIIVPFDAYLEGLQKVTADQVIELANIILNSRENALSLVGPVDTKGAQSLLKRLAD